MLKVILISLIPVFAWAQEDQVRVGADRDKTIEITHGTKTKNKFEITEGTDEVAGDPAPLLAEARKNWKTACESWKTELKGLNKNNEVLAMSCGKMSCSTASMESSCTSKANYKLKVQVN